MTRIFKSALLAATAAASIAATPALAADSSVLVVDFDQLFQNSTAGQSGSQQIKAKYNGLVQQHQNVLKTAVNSYNAQVEAIKKATKPGARPTPTPALEQAGQRVQQEQETLQQIQGEVNEVAAYVRSQIIDHARPIAEQIRAERKASVVISKDSALASDPQSDITGTLLQRLNSAFTTPSITLPQAPAAAPAATTQPAKKPQGR